MQYKEVPKSSRAIFLCWVANDYSALMNCFRDTAADQCMQSWQTRLFKNKDCAKMSLDDIAVVYYAKISFCCETNDF